MEQGVTLYVNYGCDSTEVLSEYKQTFFDDGSTKYAASLCIISNISKAGQHLKEENCYKIHTYILLVNLRLSYSNFTTHTIRFCLTRYCP